MKVEEVNQEDIEERFSYVLSLIKELREEPSLCNDMDDLELNVKLLQDKVRDRYFRMDEKRQRQIAKRNKRDYFDIDHKENKWDEWD